MKAKIITIDADEHRVGLSIKALSEESGTKKKAKKEEVAEEVVEEEAAEKEVVEEVAEEVAA